MPRGRKTALMIGLTVEERQTVQAWQRSMIIPARRARRARMLLLLAESVPLSQHADTVGITRHSPYKWAQRFPEKRLKGFADKPGRRYRPGEREVFRACWLAPQSMCTLCVRSSSHTKTCRAWCAHQAQQHVVRAPYATLVDCAPRPRMPLDRHLRRGVLARAQESSTFHQI
jgi:hypothetical protein